MAKSRIIARVLAGDRLECQVASPSDRQLTLSGATTDVEPNVEGAEELGGNKTLVDNAWAFAKFTYDKVNLPTHEEQKRADKSAKAHRDVAEWIADLADDIGRTTKRGWCSACFVDVAHEKVRRPRGQIPAYLCTNCGSPTLSCAGPGCENMAVRGRGAMAVPRYCAEHRHEIPGFSKAADTIETLTDYHEFLEYEKPNLSGTSRLVGAGLTLAAAATPMALFAAPAIGGAVGTLVGGYSGAVATNYGLALLGGGSLAAGGLGMAGGTAVVTAVGGALGGVLGASVTNAYVLEDDSFHIEMLQGGNGVPVVVCSGFLTQGGRGWGEWRDIVTARYPDSPVYRVHWGAKELDDLRALAGGGAVKSVGPARLRQAAMAANKAAAKRLGPVAPALIAADLAKNPWHVARSRADKTGVVVADLLARTEEASYVLVGHSLGARAMKVAAETLGSDPEGPRLEAVHLLGAAVGAKGDWEPLTARVDGAVYNYHSANDKVLKRMYAPAQGGQSAAGLRGFGPDADKLQNIDVSEDVERHSDYYAKVTLR